VFHLSDSLGITDWQLLTNSMARFVSLIEVAEDATNIGTVSFGMMLNLNQVQL